MRAKPQLFHRPTEWPLEWQWWSAAYLAGFHTEKRARDYGRANGWCE